MSRYLIKPEPMTPAARRDLDGLGGDTTQEYVEALVRAEHVSQLRGVRHVSVVYVKEHHMCRFTRGVRS